MKTLYLDCGMGAAGDMLAAALWELLPDREAVLEELNGLGIPGVTFAAEKSVKQGIQGTRFRVRISGEEEETGCLPDSSHPREHGPEHGHSHGQEHSHDPDHPHSHGQTNSHSHGHPHRGMEEIEEITAGLNLPEGVRAEVSSVYRLLAEAESHAHGVPVTEIHFHEVGAMDAVADIAAVCLLMDRLAPDQVIASPVHVGSGQVSCAHGILPVPAPAAAWLLQGVPIYGGEIPGELCTPTGAALLRRFVGKFGAMPRMTVERIGYGMGAKDFPAANCVRALFGESGQGEEDTVVELCCTLDDMTPEAVGFAQERFFEGGALEVYTVPAQMKKSRPGILLTVMCREKDRDQMIRLMFRHTTTLGIRENLSRRYTLSREIVSVSTELGNLRKKVSSGYGVTREKYEYEDLAGAAAERGISLAEAAEMLPGTGPR